MKEIMTITLTLFAVIDILGSIPVIIELREKSKQELRSFLATAVSGVLMLLFLYFGDNVLKFVGIGVASFAMAGAIVIFVLALEMVLGINLMKGDASEGNSASIVPLAFPLIAGAGTLTTIVSLGANHEEWPIAIAIVVNLIIVYIVLKSVGKIAKVLGKQGISVLRRVFGVILLAIAIKLFMNNFLTFKANFDHQTKAALEKME